MEGRSEAAEPRVILGVNIASGRIFLGAVCCPDVPLLDDQAMRMEIAQHLDPANALLDLIGRFVEELRRLHPAAVAVVHPRRYNGWAYRDAFARISLESAIMIAAAEQGVAFESVKQERISKKTGVPLDRYPSLLAAQLGISAPKYWGDRALAFGAGLTLAEDYS